MATRRSVGITWGFKPHICHCLYVAVVRPQITYASLFWWPRVQQTIAARELASLQRLACLCITGAFPSTPTAALDTILGLLPLDLYILGEARLAAYRLITTGNWRGSLREVGHSQIVVHNEELSARHEVRFYTDEADLYTSLLSRAGRKNRLDWCQKPCTAQELDGLVHRWFKDWNQYWLWGV